MKLSIIVPVYNMADWLPRCMESLLHQDLGDCEILLVDDGSTDGRSGELCDRYARDCPEHIRVIHKENGGLGDARNAGLEAACGEYVLFVDSDDYVSPRMTETLFLQMEQKPDVVFFGSRIEDGNASAAVPQEGLPIGRTVKLGDVPRLLLAPPNACSRLWRRSLFTGHGIRFPGRIWYEDLATTGKLYAVSERITAIPDELYHYVQRRGSIMHSSNAKRCLEIMNAAESLLDWFRSAGLYDRYEEELEAVVIRNVLLDASVRILKMGDLRGSPEAEERRRALEELRTYTDHAFPRWPQSDERRRLSGKHRIVLFLLQYRRYRMIQLLLHGSARLKGSVAS